jgi:2-polyprenyl-3-methyl-5-hydroxy-6-metoxy-1,4-benzoquinol methylase
MKSKTVKKIQNIVKNNYQEIAEEFNLSRQKELWPKLNELTCLVKEGSSVLDVGCGNGRLLKVLKDKNVKYLGCDQNEILLNLAKKNWPNKEFKICTLPDLFFGKFDYIFCIAVWHHIAGKSNRLKTLLSFKKSLNPSGQVIISVWNLRKKRKLLIWKTWFISLFKDKVDFGDIFFPWKKIGSQRYYHAFSKKEIKKIVKQAGFKIKNLEEDDYNIWITLSL